MKYDTRKFGTLELDPDAILVFPDGLIGFQNQRHWVLLSESNSDTVGWLQSLDDPGLAFCVVTPGAFVAEYALRVHRRELDELPWSREDRSLVLALVSNQGAYLTMNLKAPLLINLDRYVGRQVISCDDRALRYPLPVQPVPLRKIA